MVVPLVVNSQLYMRNLWKRPITACTLFVNLMAALLEFLLILTQSSSVVGHDSHFLPTKRPFVPYFGMHSCCVSQMQLVLYVANFFSIMTVASAAACRKPS